MRTGGHGATDDGDRRAESLEEKVLRRVEGFMAADAALWGNGLKFWSGEGQGPRHLLIFEGQQDSNECFFFFL